MLSVNNTTVRDDAGAQSLPGIVAQLRAPELPIGADGSPEYALSVQVRQFRQSTSAGPLGAWQGGEPSSVLQINGSCSVCLVGDAIVFTVLDGAAGEIVVEVAALNGILLAEFNITILPRSAPPHFELGPFPPTIPENTNFSFLLVNVSRGGWLLAPDLPIRFEFSTAGVPVVSSIDFSSCASTGGGDACQAVLTPFPSRFGNATLTITMYNDGAAFTPYAVDNVSVSVALSVSHENLVPTFELSGAGLVRVEEDSACVLSADSTCNASIPRFHRYPAYASVQLGLYEAPTPISCPPALGWTSLPGACLNQSGTFSVVNVSGDEALFAVMPAIDAAGMLSFTLNPDRNGQTTFNVSLTDDGSPVPKSSWQLLTIFVFPINDKPTFDLVAAINATEGDGAVTRVVVSNILAGPFEPLQRVTISVTQGDGAARLFNGVPFLVGGTTLVLQLRPSSFGVAELLFSARDDGGTARGGVDRSAPPKVLRVEVYAINDPPLFAIPHPLVRVEEGAAAEIVVAGFATNISAGSPNEDCAEISDFCESQRVSFVVEHVQRSFLFAALPAITAQGTLTFRTQPSTSGASRVFVRLQDDGGGVTDFSSTLFFDVVVDTVEHPPAFALRRQVECMTIDRRGPADCDCPLPTQNQFLLPACGLAAAGDVASVWVLKDAGAVSVTAFASHITTAAPYLPASMTVFSVDNSTGRLRFQERRQDPIAAARGLEFASTLAVSPDGLHVYALEQVRGRACVHRASFCAPPRARPPRLPPFPQSAVLRHARTALRMRRPTRERAARTSTRSSSWPPTARRAACVASTGAPALSGGCSSEASPPAGA